MMDMGIVLVVPRPVKRPPTAWENAFFWVKPYSWDAYVLVLLIWLLPPILVYSLEIAAAGSGGGGSVTRVYDPCTHFGCLLQLVGQTELPLSGAFPAGWVNHSYCQ
eukprot:gene21350-32873_t